METQGSKTSYNVSSPSFVQEPPILRTTISLKNKKRVREVEQVEDCFILDFDPNESFSVSSLSKSLDKDYDDENAPNLVVLGERGKVACRDFPHSRYQCLKFPFNNTPHDSHCNLCYCYVCDVAAPCDEWPDHCHATHGFLNNWWYLRRDIRRQKRGHDSQSDSDSAY